MNFVSLIYIVFFLTVTGAFYVIPSKLKKIWLLGVSYLFYMCWNPYYASLIFLSTVTTYLCAVLIEKSRDDDAPYNKKIIVVCCILINIIILFVFKYSNFVIENINSVFGILAMSKKINQFDLLLPVGISFYTFQTIGYIIDVYKDKTKAKRNIVDYALFVSFFPQLVAGPIGRASHLFRQIDKLGETVSYSEITGRIKRGGIVALYGYFEKIIIADRIAVLVNEVFSNYDTYSSLDIIFASILFAIQIYCDFDGYTNIARGSAYILGINLAENFKQPYLAPNIKEFWRRWHMSLTSWFTDYIYIPLGGNRKGVVRKYINILIVFTVSGLWHGAGWHYIIWGIMHGIYQIVWDIKNKIFHNRSAAGLTFGRKLFKIASTFIIVTFAWIFFRVNSISDGIMIVQKLFINPVLSPSFPNSLFSISQCAILMISLFILLAVDILKELNFELADAFWKQDWFVSYGCISLIIFFLLLFGVFGGEYDVSQFIYSQF